MALNDVYEVKLVGTMAGQNCINIFHYQHQVVGTSTNKALALGTEFWAKIQAPLRTLTSNAMNWAYVAVANLVDPVDFATYLVGLVGQRSDPFLAPTNPMSFTYVKGRNDMHSGGKRISGITEAVYENGLITAAYITQVISLETQLESAVISSLDVWRPVVLGRRNSSGSTLFANPISGVNFLGVTKQGSRVFYSSPGL